MMRRCDDEFRMFDCMILGSLSIVGFDIMWTMFSWIICTFGHC